MFYYDKWCLPLMAITAVFLCLTVDCQFSGLSLTLKLNLMTDTTTDI